MNAPKINNTIVNMDCYDGQVTIQNFYILLLMYSSKQCGIGDIIVPIESVRNLGWMVLHSNLNF